MEGKVDKMRSDYGPGKGNSIDSPLEKGSKGIPPKTPGINCPKDKPITSPAEKGDKGIPPMGVRPTAKPPLD